MSIQDHTMTFASAEPPIHPGTGPRFSFTCSCGVSVSELASDDLIPVWKARHRDEQQTAD